MRVEKRGAAGIWGRRLVAIPLFVVATVIAVMALPVIVCVALVSDAFRRDGRLPTTRVAFLVVAAMVVECAGLFVALGIWVITGFGLWREGLHRMDAWLQVAWGAQLFRLAMRVCRVRIRVEGQEVLTPGPVLIFMRHTSVADTLAPADLISRPSRLHPRFVMKRTLLWSPGINVMGTRNPNCFVKRGAGGESRFVGMLADELGPRDAVLIYPEGMVLTPAKEAAMSAGSAEDGGAGGARVRETYDRVHPPRLGGPLALLERARGRYDIVFVGHVGLEVAPGVRQLLRGDLIGAEVRFRMWRASGSDIPTTHSEMATWLRGRWHEMDAWVATTQDEMGVRPARH